MRYLIWVINYECVNVWDQDGVVWEAEAVIAPFRGKKKKHSLECDVPMLCEFGSRLQREESGSQDTWVCIWTLKPEAPSFPLVQKTITPATKWVSLNLLRPRPAVRLPCVFSRREITWLCVSEDCVRRCSCPARNASSLSCYSHHFQTPTFSLAALTTLSSPPFAATLLPSKVSKIQAVNPPPPKLNLCASCSKNPKLRICGWKLLFEQIKQSELDWPPRSFQRAHCSHARSIREQGRVLVYRFIIRLIVSEISIYELRKANGEPSAWSWISRVCNG